MAKTATYVGLVAAIRKNAIILNAGLRDFFFHLLASLHHCLGQV